MPFFNKSNITALFLLISAVSCSPKNGENPPTTTSVENQITELNNSNVSVKFIDQDPGYYKLLVEWPAYFNKMEVKINGESEKTKTDTNKFEKLVKHDEHLSISLIPLITNAKNESINSPFRVYAQSPKDIWIRGTKKLTKHTTIDAGRIYFSDDGRILTKGFNLKIRVQKLIVEPELNHFNLPEQYAHIVTHEYLDRSPVRINSDIQITSSTAVGNLIVVLSGINTDEDQEGVKDDEPGSLNLEIKDSMDFSATIWLRAARGGPNKICGYLAKVNSNVKLTKLIEDDMIKCNKE
jgi:hypothetical protein